MFVRKKKYPSGNIGVIVVEKIGGKMKELATIGVAYNEDEDISPIRIYQYRMYTQHTTTFGT